MKHEAPTAACLQQDSTELQGDAATGDFIRTRAETISLHVSTTEHQAANI